MDSSVEGALPNCPALMTSVLVLVSGARGLERFHYTHHRAACCIFVHSEPGFSLQIIYYFLLSI